jgi:hypothetical protein
VYRKGVARFWTESADGGREYSVLTNTALNKKNPDPEVMMQSVTDVMDSIHHAISMRCRSRSRTRSASQSYPPTATSSRLKHKRSPIIGADVLLGRDLRPFAMEINCRSSLKSLTPPAQQLE